MGAFATDLVYTLVDPRLIRETVDVALKTVDAVLSAAPAAR